MKKIILILIAVLLVFGCSEAQQNTQKDEEKQPEMPEFSTYVIGDGAVKVEQRPVIKTFTIRAVDKGFSPEIIVADSGDRIGLYVTNTRTDDVETISISGQNIEDYYHTGNTIYIEFTADKKGIYEFGDERADTRKGTLIVN